MKSFSIFLIILLSMTVASCTHNNGDIGTFFGQWIMTDVTADGTRPEEVTATDWNWRFQSSVLLISKIDQVAHTHTEYWATWTDNGSTLSINYKNTDRDHTGNYDYPVAIGFTQPTEYVLTIENSSSTQMTLKMVNPEGVNYVYTLKKN